LEVELRRSVQPDKSLALEPSRLEQLILRLGEESRKAGTRGQDVALLTDSSMRRQLRHVLARSLPDLAVIAYQEIPSDLLLQPAAMIRPEDLVSGASSPAQVRRPAA
jgi:flagellar biosynthesis protein FlhA